MYSTSIARAAGLILIASLAAVTSPAQARDNKITICHVPPGNPDNAHTITISENAWPAHQSHGDSRGPCPDTPGDDDEDDDEAGNGGDGGSADGGGGDGEDNGGGGDGGEALASNGFVVILCDSRANSMGRRIGVSSVGRVMVEETECQ